MDGGLTPLGERTLAGFCKKWGEEKGPEKFQEALDTGLIDRTKMELEPMTDEMPDADRAAEGDLGTLDPDELEDEPLDADEATMNATQLNPSSSSQPLPKGGGLMELLGRTSEASAPPKAKAKKKKSKLPPLPARSAPGAFQARPG